MRIVPRSSTKPAFCTREDSSVSGWRYLYLAIEPKGRLAVMLGLKLVPLQTSRQSVKGLTR